MLLITILLKISLNNSKLLSLTLHFSCLRGVVPTHLKVQQVLSSTLQKRNKRQPQKITLPYEIMSAKSKQRRYKIRYWNHDSCQTTTKKRIKEKDVLSLVSLKQSNLNPTDKRLEWKAPNFWCKLNEDCEAVCAVWWVRGVSARHCRMMYLIILFYKSWKAPEEEEGFLLCVQFSKSWVKTHLLPRLHHLISFF